MADDKSGASDTALGWFWIGCVLVAVFMLFWYFQGDAIKSVLRWIRYGELWLVALIMGDNHNIFWRNTEVRLGDLKEMALSMPVGEVNWTFLDLLTRASMPFYKWFFVAALTAITIYVYFRGPQSEFRTRFSIDTLIKKQAENFPVIEPFIKFNPGKLPSRPPGAPVPAELPLFAEALGPEEWVAYNQIPVPDGELDPAATARAFGKQLGPRWKGAKNLPPHKQILLAAFVLKASRKRVDADNLLGRLARCWSHDKGLNLKKDKKLLNEARKVLRDKKLAQNTLSLCNQHGWETTALMRALFYARSEGGVMASGQFVWLRGQDRQLWYPLNNLGRNSYHLEALGAMCHYKAEKLARRPIPKPKVEDAVESIAEYIKSDKARPIPQIDYSGSKKRGIKKMKNG